jgi:hypothetical protein
MGGRQERHQCGLADAALCAGVRRRLHNGDVQRKRTAKIRFANCKVWQKMISGRVFPIKKSLVNLSLVLLSVLFSLALAEVVLRTVYPRYQYAAESKYKQDVTRIWSRRANERDSGRHPDSGQPHLVYHNNLALRQHRNFAAQDFQSAINIGFFGDSFTENLRLPAQYSFTEPLDYLLNLGQIRFNVLNLGIDGYGTDQEFLYYQEFEYGTVLDYVFYVFSANDLRNIYENNLYAVDDSGTLIRYTAPTSPWWVRVLSKLHLTYLGLDIMQRLTGRGELGEMNERHLKEYFARREHVRERFHSPYADAIEQSIVSGEANEDLNRSILIFQNLLRSWKEAVERNGGRFYIVLLPIEEHKFAIDLFGEEYTVINLYEKYTGGIDNYNYSHYSFRNDGHWNEAGNQLAAVYLYRFLEQEAWLAPRSDEEVMEALFTYYSAFADEWMPKEWVKKTAASVEVLAGIRGKYLALEDPN